MSQNCDDNWAHFNVRCEVELRDRALADAKRNGQSLAEWIRRAMMEKLQRVEYQDKEGVIEVRDVVRGEVEHLSKEDLNDLVRELVAEMNAEIVKESNFHLEQLKMQISESEKIITEYKKKFAESEKKFAESEKKFAESEKKLSEMPSAEESAELDNKFRQLISEKKSSSKKD